MKKPSQNICSLAQNFLIWGSSLLHWSHLSLHLDQNNWTAKGEAEPKSFQIFQYKVPSTNGWMWVNVGQCGSMWVNVSPACSKARATIFKGNWFQLKVIAVRQSVGLNSEGCLDAKPKQTGWSLTSRRLYTCFMPLTSFDNYDKSTSLSIAFTCRKKSACKSCKMQWFKYVQIMIGLQWIATCYSVDWRWIVIGLVWLLLAKPIVDPLQRFGKAGVKDARRQEKRPGKLADAVRQRGKSILIRLIKESRN